MMSLVGSLRAVFTCESKWLVDEENCITRNVQCELFSMDQYHQGYDPEQREKRNTFNILSGIFKLGTVKDFSVQRGRQY
jgi:hypothetical protein